ncbi:hypothetical protein Pcinc_023423 [Petrolisthes cinctipes]|uniref:Uncharacterized protein n=1 Tax=Petrolisthes cinctipes TaxID=88211 RepID=A0AAE1F9W0_PETCI|nr:hypothetical protein Pcinc_024455 [Petrolisthes cinctipes]KAK3871436.1 hypothetical protein Pcinc_023423 [Petrolisthes cinctipes]
MSDEATVASAENNVSTPTEKRNRLSITSRAKAEGEALLKEMGFDDKETPGRRRTRAAIRGDVYTPPAKKERKSPAPGSGRRGRPPKKTEGKKEEEPIVEEKEKEEVKEKEKKTKDEKKEEEVEEEKTTTEEGSADGEADETKAE